MARPVKTLAERVRDCTFEGRREAHRVLLDGEILADDDLGAIQGEYQAAEDEGVRRALALEFERAVKAGKGRRAREELDAILEELGPPGSAERIIGMFPRFYRLENGEPWVLDDEMQEFIREAHKRDAEGRRVYKIILYGVPKGGAKTPMATGHGLEGLTRNDGVTPRVFQVAGSRDQAQIGTDYAEVWVNGTDEQPGELAQWVKTTRGKLTLGRGEYSILSSDGRLGHGRKPTIGIVDEWWLFNSLREREAYTALESALHKEPESYLLAITTEGWDPHSQLAQFKDRHVRDAPSVEVRRDGCLTIARDAEQGVLVWWYGAPEDFDPDAATDDELLDVIRLCNPGPWIDHRDQRRSYRRAADKYAARRLILNQRTKTQAAWLPAGAWQACHDPALRIPEGADIMVGIDAAYSDDCTACAWAWKADDGRIVVRAQAWTVHADQPGEYVSGGTLDNESLVEPLVHRLHDRYNVREVVFDPRYFASESQHLADAGFEIAPVYPQSSSMREAEQEFKKAVLNGKLAHDGDQVLASHVDAVVWKQTGSGGKIDKLAGRKIDAAAAAIMAVWRATLSEPAGFFIW